MKQDYLIQGMNLSNEQLNLQSVIYKIVNNINNKIYIGKSSNIKRRLSQYSYMLKFNLLHNSHLQSSILKYGRENFTFEILEFSNEENLNNREKYWIDFYKSYNPKFGYNKTFGGDGLIATEEIKLKISNSLIGITHSDERKLNQSESHKGKTLSDETKIKQSNSQKIRFQENSEIIKHRLAMSKEPIIQLELDGAFVKEFISIREAERITKIHSSTISRVCKNKRKSGGNFLWKYKKDYEQAREQAILKAIDTIKQV